VPGRISDDLQYFEIADGVRLAIAGAPGLGETVLAGRDYILGIRPEHMAPIDSSARISLKVDACELLGADNLAYGKWGPHDVVARLPHEQRPTMGDLIQLGLPAHRLHFFDAQSGKRVE